MALVDRDPKALIALGYQSVFPTVSLYQHGRDVVSQVLRSLELFKWESLHACSVTGAFGFAGWHLVRHLRDRGDTVLQISPAASGPPSL